MCVGSAEPVFCKTDKFSFRRCNTPSPTHRTHPLQKKSLPPWSAQTPGST